jgi:hypothetical protein
LLALRFKVRVRLVGRVSVSVVTSRLLFLLVLVSVEAIEQLPPVVRYVSVVSVAVARGKLNVSSRSSGVGHLLAAFAGRHVSLSTGWTLRINWGLTGVGAAYSASRT